MHLQGHGIFYRLIYRWLVQIIFCILQTLEQSQRRKEIYQALVSQMEVVFAFLQGLLERHYQGYNQEKETQEKARHGRVCQAVLETYNAFVEWVPITHIMANEQVCLRFRVPKQNCLHKSGLFSRYSGHSI